jgi:hypothetical protein
MTADGDYGISVTPVYPPKKFSMMIYFEKAPDNEVAVI